MKCFLVCSASQAFGGLGALRNVPQSYIIGCEVGRQRAFVARVLRPCCAFRGSTHRVTRVTFRVHIARRCPGVRSVGGRRVQRLHTWRHIAQILRPHGANMPWSAFCWGWGVSEAPHMASHWAHTASTRREYALECVLLGVGAFRGSTHGVTRVTFRVHTARICPGVRSVGGGRVQRLHTLRHIAQISRLIGPICALYCRGIASAPVTAPFAR